jgi:hypothetical protein
VNRTEPKSDTNLPAPLQEALEGCDAERVRLLAQPFTPAASRAVEAVDELSDHIWDALEESP